VSPVPGCVPEWKLGAYVDGEVTGAAARQLETHLVTCERCRRTVMELREEASVLSRALRSTGPGGAIEVVPEAPARGMLTGLPIGIAAAIGIATAVSLVMDARLPAGLDWLRPARLLGVSDMFWNVVFMLRDDAPGLLEFAVALGALASVAALGAFVAGAISRRITGSASMLVFSIGALAVLSAPPSARAAPEVRTDAEIIHVRADETIDGAFIASGEVVIIEGRVAGDALVWAQRVEVSGVIEGNLIAGGDDLDLRGEFQGTVVAAGDELHFDGHAARSAFLAGGGATVGGDATLESDLYLAGERVQFAGRVGRDLILGGRRVDVTGSIGRDLSVSGESIDITGDVVRNLQGFVRKTEDLQIDAGARVGGTVAVEARTEAQRSRFHRYAQAHFWVWRVVWLAGAFVVGLLLYWIVPALFRVRVATGTDFAMALGIGILSVPVVLLAAALLAITIVGLPLAVLGLVLYCVACYVAFLLVAGLLGRHITRPEVETVREFGLSLLVGLALLMALVELPWIGGPARWVLMLSGLGLLARRARDAWRDRAPRAY